MYEPLSEIAIRRRTLSLSQAQAAQKLDPVKSTAWWGQMERAEFSPALSDRIAIARVLRGGVEDFFQEDGRAIVDQRVGYQQRLAVAREPDVELL